VLLEEQDVDGRLIFRWIRKKNWTVWIGIVWFRVGRIGGDELSDSIKSGEFLEQLENSQLLKKDSAAYSKLIICVLTQSDPAICRTVDSLFKPLVSQQVTSMVLVSVTVGTPLSFRYLLGHR
jgi:hypothetical protein